MNCGYTLALVLALGSANAAHADEFRVETRGGHYKETGYSQDIYGFAVGYDVDVAKSVFVGAEVSVDQIANGLGRLAYGFSGRIGARINDRTKVYIDGGRTTKFCGLCVGSYHFSGGAQYRAGKRLYVRAGWRVLKYDVDIPDGNAATLGVGFEF